MHRIEQGQDQDVRADLHALGVLREIRHHRDNLQHLQRAGQVVVWEPERGEAGIARGACLRDKRRDMCCHILARLELRVEEQSDFHNAPSCAPTAAP